jgi:peroxin-4
MNYYKNFINQFSKLTNDLNYEWIMIDDSESDNIRLLLEGPKNSPYEDGLYKIELEFYDIFPNSPPHVKFITKIWHPLVEYITGKMCQDYFKENWSDKNNVKNFVDLLQNLLVNYNFSSGVNLDAINDLKEGNFEKKAKEINQRYALE